MELPDLSGLFGQPRQLTPEQEEHARRIHEMEHQGQAARMEAFLFFAPVLCDCKRRYDPRDSSPPQADCLIHGVLMVHPCTGQVIYPGYGEVYPRADDHDGGHDHDRRR